MFDNYLIEVSGKPAGIIARDTNGFRFHASENDFNDLNGQIFPDPQTAERAARKLLTKRRGSNAVKNVSNADEDYCMSA